MRVDAALGFAQTRRNTLHDVVISKLRLFVACLGDVFRADSSHAPTIYRVGDGAHWPAGSASFLVVESDLDLLNLLHE